MLDSIKGPLITSLLSTLAALALPLLTFPKKGSPDEEEGEEEEEPGVKDQGNLDSLSKAEKKALKKQDEAALKKEKEEKKKEVEEKKKKKKEEAEKAATDAVNQQNEVIMEARGKFKDKASEKYHEVTLDITKISADLPSLTYRSSALAVEYVYIQKQKVNIALEIADLQAKGGKYAAAAAGAGPASGSITTLAAIEEANCANAVATKLQDLENQREREKIVKETKEVLIKEKDLLAATLGKYLWINDVTMVEIDPDYETFKKTQELLGITSGIIESQFTIIKTSLDIIV